MFSSGLNHKVYVKGRNCVISAYCFESGPRMDQKWYTNTAQCSTHFRSTHHQLPLQPPPKQKAEMTVCSLIIVRTGHLLIQSAWLLLIIFSSEELTQLLLIILLTQIFWNNINSSTTSLQIYEYFDIVFDIQHIQIFYKNDLRVVLPFCMIRMVDVVAAPLAVGWFGCCWCWTTTILKRGRSGGNDDAADCSCIGSRSSHSSSSPSSKLLWRRAQLLCTCSSENGAVCGAQSGGACRGEAKNIKMISFLMA